MAPVDQRAQVLTNGTVLLAGGLVIVPDTNGDLDAFPSPRRSAELHKADPPGARRGYTR